MQTRGSHKLTILSISDPNTVIMLPCQSLSPSVLMLKFLKLLDLSKLLDGFSKLLDGFVKIDTRMFKWLNGFVEVARLIRLSCTCYMDLSKVLN